MEESYRWPGNEATADLRDGLTTWDVIEALYAPVSLRVDHRVPPGPTDAAGGVRADGRAAADRGGL